MSRPTRILVDCRYLRADGRHDGISRYTAGVVTALARLHPLAVLVNDERQLDHLPEVPWHLMWAPTSPLELLAALRINRLRPDVLFSPMQTIGSAGRRYGLVLTLHDLIYYRHRTPPREFAPWLRGLWRLYHLAWWPQRLLLNRADAVATVSATTAELIAEHRLTRRPVAVVANAADPEGPVPERTAPATRTLVYMGAFIGYKDVDTLVRAMQHLPEYELLLMSRTPPGEQDRLIALAPDAGLRFFDGASDEEYRSALLGATALVTASRDEGFGIPLVEAMSVGTPVVVTDIPIFREVGGDAALYVPAGDVPAFAAAVRALEAPGEWARRSALALRQAAEFSWGASAERLLKLLLGVARERG